MSGVHVGVLRLDQADSVEQWEAQLVAAKGGALVTAEQRGRLQSLISAACAASRAQGAAWVAEASGIEVRRADAAALDAYAAVLLAIEALP